MIRLEIKCSNPELVSAAVERSECDTLTEHLEMFQAALLALGFSIENVRRIRIVDNDD